MHDTAILRLHSNRMSAPTATGVEAAATEAAATGIEAVIGVEAATGVKAARVGRQRFLQIFSADDDVSLHKLPCTSRVAADFFEIKPMSSIEGDAPPGRSLFLFLDPLTHPHQLVVVQSLCANIVLVHEVFLKEVMPHIRPLHVVRKPLLHRSLSGAEFASLLHHVEPSSSEFLMRIYPDGLRMWNRATRR